MVSFSQLPAQACDSGNPQSIDYIKRDNNRCEGIKNRRVTGGVNLISFATRSIPQLGSTLKLAVPQVYRETPEITVRSMVKDYQLDSISPQKVPQFYIFTWATQVINSAGVPKDSLRATAFNPSNRVYLPVILGKTSGKYEFILYSSKPAKINSFKILLNNKVVHTSSPKISTGGEIVFIWDAKTATAGNYQLLYEVETGGRKFSKKESFQHNPKWLK